MDSMEFKAPKTRDFTKLLSNVKADERKTLVILSDVDKEMNTFLSARNMPSVLPLFYTDVLLDDLLNANSVVMSKETAKLIEGRLN